MSLERKLDARRMVENARMSARPEFYSGRGATTSDVTSTKLENIYEQVEKEYGSEAAQSFVQMIADIPVLSATDFLLSLYRLQANGWIWDKRLLGTEKGIDVGSDYHDGRREASALGTVVHILGGSMSRDETSSIRNPFLRNHGVKISEDEYSWGIY